MIFVSVLPRGIASSCGSSGIFDALQGLRTFHATNYKMSEGNRTAHAAHNETYVYYPDDAPLHSLALKGDSRAALVPFMAHKFATHLSALAPAANQSISTDRSADPKPHKLILFHTGSLREQHSKQN